MLSHVLQSASACAAGYYHLTAKLKPQATAAAASAAAQAAGTTPTASLPDQKLFAATTGYLGMCSKRFGWQVRVLIHTMPAQTLLEKDKPLLCCHPLCEASLLDLVACFRVEYLTSKEC